MYHLATQCRACGYGPSGASGIKSGAPTEKLAPVFSLGIQPLANDFCKAGEARAGYAPLDVLLCPRCHLAQLSAIVSPEILYSRNYPYVTSTSQMMQEHFRSLMRDILSECSPRSVIEIGSNDGLLLEFIRDQFSVERVLGVDPAPNLCESARKRGIETMNAFFGSASAELLSFGYRPDVIIARHVLCHCPDWRDFVKGLERISGPDTLICIETPYVQDLLDKAEFDTIYHEHLSYLSLQAIQSLLLGTKLYLHRIVRYPIHGGAVMLMLRHGGRNQPPHHSVQQFLDAEQVGPEKWEAFATAVGNNVSKIKAHVANANREGKTVAALGASAKFTVLANYCGFRPLDVRFVADSTVWKQYSTVPGTGIPVVDEGALLRELPDLVIAGCWNFRRELLAKNAVARSKGVKFLFPCPSAEVE